MILEETAEKNEDKTAVVKNGKYIYASTEIENEAIKKVAQLQDIENDIDLFPVKLDEALDVNLSGEVTEILLNKFFIDEKK